MISPGFFGLFNAQRGLLASQTALNTLNHNISNANTPGYTRQRVELEALFPYSAPGLEQSHDLSGQFGQLGQGVYVTEITRIRDSFLDTQYRLESSVQGYNSTLLDGLKSLESTLAEPSQNGINNAVQKFFETAQELHLSPESLAARTNFVQQASDMVTLFQQQARQLSDLRRNLVGDASAPGSIPVSQLGIKITQINEKLETIRTLNEQINVVVASNAEPNDLYDKRDKLLDELSQLVNIDVQNTANGQINVSIGGQRLVQGVTLRDTLQVIANPGPVPTPDELPVVIQTTTGLVALNNTIQSGDIKALLTIGGNGADPKSIYSVMNDLSTLLDTLATQVNTLQTAGRDINGNANPPVLFTLNAGTTLPVFRYQVNSTLINDPGQVAAAITDPTASGPPAGFAGKGDGRNALAIAQIREQAFATLANTNVSDYYNALLSGVGIDTNSYDNRAKSQDAVVESLNQRRESVSGVNINEEMIDMIRFQRAFEASSKMIKVFDEVTQTIIGLIN